MQAAVDDRSRMIYLLNVFELNAFIF